MALAALRDALQRRQPPKGVLHHSDRGCQYVDADYVALLAAAGLERRLNLIYFLNEGWKPEYGGELKLFDESGLTPVASFAPIANRCVIFETSETSFHGHPEPMKLPRGVRRKSIALYYYALPRPERKRHRIIFAEDREFEHKVTEG